MEPKTLSSSLTFFSKFVFPAIWFGILALGLTESEADMTPAAHAKRLAFGGATGMLILWGLCGLKRVRIDKEFLYVSNYLRETVIPLDLIDRVREYWWLEPGYVAVHFRQPTDIGTSIRFVAKFQSGPHSFPLLRLFTARVPPHPVVAELKNAATLSA
jgi:hypothetical protein